ncbi:type VI secretion system baseplate subunit TssE [Glaciimonas sp. GG7]
MSRTKNRYEHAYLPTLIDRLQDHSSNLYTEKSDEYIFDVQAMHNAIKRDLSLLLNTINLSGELDITMIDGVASSVLNYGLPPLSGGYIADRNWNKVEVIIRKAILDFEPRVMPESLLVIPNNDDKNDNYNVLLFELHGLIHWSPYPLEFRIKSAFDLEASAIILHPI